MQRLYFGTDGVRGPYGGPVMNEEFVARLGAAAARWLDARGVSSGKVLIGRDTRASGASLAAAVGAGVPASQPRRNRYRQHGPARSRQFLQQIGGRELAKSHVRSHRPGAAGAALRVLQLWPDVLHQRSTHRHRHYPWDARQPRARLSDRKSVVEGKS